MSEELIEWVLIAIIAGAVVSIILLFLMNMRLTSGFFGNLYWLRAAIEAIMIFAGIKSAF